MPRECNVFTRSLYPTYFYLVFALPFILPADIKVYKLPLLRIRILLPAEPQFYLHNRKIISAQNALNDNFEDSDVASINSPRNMKPCSANTA